jgi:DNA-binding GntR family transcriptional regulator
MRKKSARPRKTPRKHPADGSLTERIHARLLEEIGSGQIAAGSRLTEAELTERYRASRGPVREALRLLHADGIVVMRAHSGALVRRLSRDEIVEILQVREVLEGLAARVAASLAHPAADRAELQRAFEAMREAVAGEDLALYVERCYVDLHQIILRMAHHRMLMQLWSRLNLLVFREQLRPLIDLPLMRRSHHEHGPLVESILAGRPDDAERAMREHIAHFIDHVQRLPDRVFAQSSRRS